MIPGLQLIRKFQYSWSLALLPRACGACQGSILLMGQFFSLNQVKNKSSFNPV